MFEHIKNLYEAGKLTKENLNNAVAKGWITKAQLKEITSKKK